ncbi:TIGR04255 family protein [Halomonas sp. HAL1]|uniref:TIGR04255 family protein n=1 Tax=Halomonas sp. HAL1 TaxID=550984 RepID=UPI00022D2DE2|nr:TIGR04255 family protein [Halomonas sp. HAL1]EHA16581.1 hypothetical protein HAL1_05888 [Halomonas sp. HAL1]WKV93305.1 TIGR04255 family protein [Halomonas sp. HAL1]
MKERFSNPPLREIIAEITWDQPDMGQDHDLTESVYQQAFEETFNDFLDKVGERGYTRSERLVPVNFLCPPEQVVFRAKHSNFRKGKDVESKAIYQMGYGVFTVNVVPPYTTWDEFSPLVKSGLEDFLSLSLPGGSPEEYKLKLRYVNAFDEELTKGKSHKDFLSEALNVSLNVPDVFIKESAGSVELPLLDIVIPLEFGKLKLRLAEGMVNSTKAFILDMAVVFNITYSGDVEEIMDAFSRGRESVHKIFVSMTKILHEEMGLSEGES